MEIVIAELVDVEGLAELNKGLIEDERHPNPMDVAQLTRRMKEWLAGGYFCYLVKENSRIIAYCLFRDEGSYYYMRQLYVRKAYRRKGIATQLPYLMPSNSPRSRLQYPGSSLIQKVSRTQYRNVLKRRHQLKILVACDDTIRFSHESRLEQLVVFRIATS